MSGVVIRELMYFPLDQQKSVLEGWVELISMLMVLLTSVPQRVAYISLEIDTPVYSVAGGRC